MQGKTFYFTTILIIVLALVFTPALLQAEDDVVEDVLEEHGYGEEEAEEESEDPENSDENSNEPDNDQETEPESEFETEEEPEEPRVSTVFFHEDIREALTELSLQTGVNIIYDETVVGTVTLDLEDVPLEKALDMMLVSGGYTYHKIEDYYLVGKAGPESPMFDELTETETIRLDYISASTAVELLPPFYEDFVSTSADRDRTLTITAPPAVIEEFKQDLTRIDTAPEEIEVEVVVTEISTEVLEERGSDLFGLTSQEAEESFSLEFDGAFALEAAGPAGQLMSELKILEEEGKAQIEANPSIRVSAQESAELFIGEERVLMLEREEDDVIEDVEVGVSMEVTPQIMAEDELRLEIAPEVSHFTDERADELVVRRSELASVVRAGSGETITIAGMTLDEMSEYVSSVPLLGDMPFMRWFFREETEKRGERELLVFITPQIISGD